MDEMYKPPSSEIELSVVITTYNARDTVARCLASLRPQTARGGIEIVLVDSSSDGTADLVAERFPEVRLLRFETRKYCGGARNLGIAEARGDVIAFIDADCVADPDWAEAVLAAHRAHPHPIIGGAVVNGNPDSYVGWGYYFGEFGAWMPGLEQREVDEVPGCALSLKRWAFEQHGPFIEGTYCSDSAFHWSLAREGYKPLFVPSIRISHINVDRLGHFLTHEVQHGRNFGRVRSIEQGLPTWKKAALAAATPALPLLLFARTLAHAVKRRRYRRRFLRAAPVLLAGQAAWSYGEMLGYLSSLRSAPQSRTPRPVARAAEAA